MYGTVCICFCGFVFIEHRGMSKYEKLSKPLDGIISQNNHIFFINNSHFYKIL